MRRVISCAEAVDRLWEFLDHGLDDHDHRAVDEHLAFCVRCCGELEFIRQLRRLLGTDTAGLPAEVEVRLAKFIERLTNSAATEGRA
jgi:anti-sigma factor (TIGR02949 family)